MSPIPVPGGVSGVAEALRRRLAAEDGVSLVETLISAVILVIVVGAVMTTIDASGRTAAANRGRTVAATLAEEDQERMRAISAAELSNYSELRTVTRDGQTYQVQSKTDWLYDATDTTETCSTKTTQANYLRMSSTVTSAVVGTRIKPVTMRSLVTPRVDALGAKQGTLGVLVKDQLGKPVRNMPVSISGPLGASESTNDDGC